MGLFRKSKTADEVARTLSGQIDYLKLAMFELWSGRNSAGSQEGLEVTTYIAQCINYWFAEDPMNIDKNLPIEQVRRIKRIQRIVPLKSHDALELNKDFRKTIVYALRMKLVLNMSLYDKAWLSSDEYQRIRALLDRYGAEFPEEVTDRKFDKLVNRIARTQHTKEC